MMLNYIIVHQNPSSLDAILIQKLGVVLLDGTSPHVVDPKDPGAIDENS